MFIPVHCSLLLDRQLPVWRGGLADSRRADGQGREEGDENALPHGLCHCRQVWQGRCGGCVEQFDVCLSLSKHTPIHTVSVGVWSHSGGGLGRLGMRLRLKSHVCGKLWCLEINWVSTNKLSNLITVVLPVPLRLARRRSIQASLMVGWGWTLALRARPSSALSSPGLPPSSGTGMWHTI